MANCNITLEIFDYEPKNNHSIVINDLICIFILDNYEGSINIGQYKLQKINHQVKNIKNDIKYLLKIFNLKTMNIIGLSEIILPLSLIQNPCFLSQEIKKKCIISIIDSILEKKFILSINIKIDLLNLTRNNILSNKSNKTTFFKRKKIMIQNFNFMMDLKNSFHHFTPNIYKSKQIINSQNKKLKTYSNISSCSFRTNRKSIEKKNKSRSNDKNNFYNLKIGFEKDNLIKSRLKSKSNLNKYDNLNTSPYSENNFKTHKKYINSATDIRPCYEISKNNSLIEGNFFIETEDNTEKINKKIYSSLNNLKQNKNKFNIKSRKILNNNNVKDKIENIINFHSLLILKVNTLLEENKKLNQNLILNKNRINFLFKQKNRLNQLKLNLNSIKIKVNLNFHCNKNIYRNEFQIHKKEFKIFQNIFNSYYFEYDILKYKESLIIKNLDDKKKIRLLLNCITACIFTYGNISEIYSQNEILKNKFKSLLLKYNLKENDDSFIPNIKDNIIILKTLNNKNYECNTIKEVDEKDEDSDDSFNDYKKDKIINEIENKKISPIQLNNISSNIFQFGKKK